MAGACIASTANTSAKIRLIDCESHRPSIRGAWPSPISMRERRSTCAQEGEVRLGVVEVVFEPLAQEYGCVCMPRAQLFDPREIPLAGRDHLRELLRLFRGRQ